jgi:glutathione S-transferase
MIQIYGSKRSSAFRCYWLLEELGIPYETMPLDFAKQEHKSEQYLKLNPNGKVPTMIDDGFVLWESVAINYYLMEKYNAVQFVGTTMQEHAEVNKWNIWAITHLSESFHPLVMQKYFKTPDSEATKNAREQELPRYLSVLDTHLADKEYMALGKFTLADITTMSVVQAAGFADFDLSTYANIMIWMGRLSEREAYKRASV